MLSFEVLDFSGPNHIILGWPCYVKFMAQQLCLPQAQDTWARQSHHYGGQDLMSVGL
jgi:hypothetical protein